MDDLVSVVIPARNEQFLVKTVDDLFAKARGPIEVIVVLEGYWPDPMPEDRPGLHFIHNGEPRGMRGAINQAVAVAKGKWVMKSDAHCMYAEGFDLALRSHCQPDWILVPTRYSLDPEVWDRKRKRPIEYMYLCAPTNEGDFGGPSLHGRVWGTNMDKRLEDDELPDLMSAQGSCWFMHRDYFYHLELLDDVNYGHFCFEFQEIGLKCWLSGGKVKRDRTTWYAHLHKGRKYGRGWPLRPSVLDKGAAYSNKWMDGQLWHKQDRDIRWLINYFWPVPTWDPKSVRLVFHRRRGGSGEIRGSQMARHLLARINPTTGWGYDFDVHVWVKQEPRDLTLPGKHYLDVLDEPRRVSWLKAHPECGVIASSKSGLAYLQKELGRNDILFIPQHHCNYENEMIPSRPVKVVGVVGGQGALQFDMDEFQAMLDRLGLEFRWLRAYKSREDVVEFYRGIDVQVVWRKQQRPLKNPLKIINAMSFRIPTVAYPEIAYSEIEGLYHRATDMQELENALVGLQSGAFPDKKAREDMRWKAAEYHIDIVSKLYDRLLS